MIGKITFGSASRCFSATLDDDLRWECADPEQKATLEQQFPAESVEGMPNVVVGRHLLYQAAERLGGRVELPSRRRYAEKVLV